jgi:tetratricopeptide (TPR) repeat protein
MAAYSVLHRARKLLNARRFPKVIAELEPQLFEFRQLGDSPEVFEYYYLLGTACLYSGDIGGADTYYKNAWQKNHKDPNLLNARAVLFLRSNNTDRAVECYLEVLDIQPSNKIASKALEFIKLHGDGVTILEWVRNGKIKQFFPPLGVNPSIIRVSIGVLAAAVLVLFSPLYLPQITDYITSVSSGARVISGKRADLSSFALTADEAKQTREITSSYNNAQKLVQAYRDNAAQLEINRILNSDAAPSSIKQKARLLAGYLTEPTFDSFNMEDNYSYKTVADNPALYTDCWVRWQGKVANAVTDAAGTQCNFLVGYDTLQVIDGIVILSFDKATDIDPALPVEVLAKIVFTDGKLSLQGKSLYQRRIY